MGDLRGGRQLLLRLPNVNMAEESPDVFIASLADWEEASFQDLHSLMDQATAMPWRDQFSSDLIQNIFLTVDH